MSVEARSSFEVRTARWPTSNGHLASSMTSSAPLPILPIEIKAAVLSFADQPTLAAACRTSLALLQLAGPLLYESIEVETHRALRLLFCPTVRLLRAR